MTLVHILLACAGLLVVNAAFVAAEFALIASPRPSLERRSAGGDRLARRFLDILRSPERQDRYIATAQLGITVASLGLGMYGEHGLAALLEPWMATAAASSAARPSRRRLPCSCSRSSTS